MILYHWTERHNLTSIMYGGLDPRYHTGGMAVVWLAAKRSALSLSACVSRTHRVSQTQLCLLRVNVSRAGLWTWAVKGVYRSPNLIPPDRVQWVAPECLYDYRPIRIARTQG